jgi:hypothetical protein
MSKSLLLFALLILGIVTVALLGQASLQQAQLEILRLQADRLQQQNNALIARQAQLDSEKEYVLSQNQQMQRHIASLQAAYQQVRGQNQRLRAIVAVSGQLIDVNWSSIFWLGLAGLLATATIVITALAVARPIVPALSQSSGNPPDKLATDNPWASPEYRFLAIQKARQIEQWERQSVLAYWNPHRTSMTSYQETTSTNLR